MIVGIHTPETAQEREKDRTREKVREAEFEFPILIDNDRTNWSAWGNSMWPTVYLIDKQGYIRDCWYGELNWKQRGGEAKMRKRIEELLEEETATEPET